MLRTNGQFNAGDKKIIYLMTGPRLYENPGACFTKHV